MQKNIVVVLIVLCIASGILSIFLFLKVFDRDDSEESLVKKIASFADCAAAGYPIMESYPEQCRTADGVVFVNSVASLPAVTTTDPSDCNPVLVLSHVEGGLLGSSAVVTGTARGLWFFEASFPVELVDAHGVVVTTTIAQANGEWMTEECVPFTAPIEFDVPATQSGMLRFKKDNPSGEPQYDASYDFPVQFWQQML